MKKDTEESCLSGHCHRHSHNHNHDDGHGHSHCGSHNQSVLHLFGAELLSAVLMCIALIIPWESKVAELIAFIVAVLPVGIPIVRSTVKEWANHDFFNEFTLMVMASIGAFCIGEFAEGVAVLLFYSVGEKLEDVVSGDVKGQIKRLIGKMPKHATVIEGDKRVETSPEDVKPGMTIAVKPGESVPLDGILETEDGADFNTAAITGESMPRTYAKGTEINSGIIPIDREVLLKVTREWNDSSMSRIMKMIEDASQHRAPSETILRKITRWYTPLVFGAALLLFIIPLIISLINPDFQFEWSTWLRRSLVFLVCSCPCALIVSIPLTYFASIGIASKKGILFKGHDSLDAMRNVNVVLFDKTGTVTTGSFHVESIKPYADIEESRLLSIAAAIEKESQHPLAKAIVQEATTRTLSLPAAEGVKTENHGMTAEVDGRKIIIGSARIMQGYGIETEHITEHIKESGTTVLIAVDGTVAGSISLADTVKPGVAQAVKELHNDGIKEIGIISGDAKDAVEKAAVSIDADFAEGELMPADKQRIIKGKEAEGNTVAFAGDGVNDAPALAAANVGIAMGNVGTDLAIESAQVVIAGDDLRKIHEGINISRKVKHVIIENVSFAFGVKLIVMILGAFGIASLWAAVFADTGVTVITVLWTLFRLKIWQLKKRTTI